MREGVEPGPLGLLATSATLEAGIYSERLAAAGFSCRPPDAAGQAEVVRAIALVKSGQLTEAGAIFRRQIEAHLAAGCGRVVLACTEVPLALEGEADASVLIDATDALARACVDAMRPGAVNATSLAA